MMDIMVGRRRVPTGMPYAELPDFRPRLQVQDGMGARAGTLHPASSSNLVKPGQRPMI